jgi:predicted O-methyltransferase YrrM
VDGSPRLQRSWWHGLQYLLSLRGLSPGVARFLWQAWRHATRTGDRFSLDSAVRPAQLAALVALARGRRRIVELGTGTGWTAIALALDDSRREVISYDPVVRPEREAYLALACDAVRNRVELRNEEDVRGPRPGEAAELLFIDSSHDRESVLAAFRAWHAALMPGSVVAFHDYGHPEYPGVHDAILELGLVGAETNGIFVWHAS